MTLKENVGSEQCFQFSQYTITVNYWQKSMKNQPMQKQLVLCLENKVSKFSSDFYDTFLTTHIPVWRLLNPNPRNFFDIHHISYI